jgi:hypothetical protein
MIQFFVLTTFGGWLSMREIISMTPKEIEYRRLKVFHGMLVWRQEIEHGSVE